MSELELKKQLSSSDIICPECIKNDDPDKLADNEANADDNEPPVNTKIIYISKTSEEHAKHILAIHPESKRVSWAKAELERIEASRKKASEPKPKDEALKVAIKEVLDNPEPQPQKPPKVSVFKRLMSHIPKLTLRISPKVKPVARRKFQSTPPHEGRHRKKKISL